MSSILSYRRIMRACAILLLASAGTCSSGAEPVPAARNNVRPELVPSVGHANTVTALAYSPDGRLLASVGRDRAARIWRGRTGELLRVLSGVGSPLLAVAFSPDSRTVVTAAANGSVQWWNAETGKQLGQTSTVSDTITAIAIRAVGPGGVPFLIASAHTDRKISVVRYRTIAGPAETVATLAGHENPIGALAFSPDGHLLASGGKDGDVKVWEVDDGLLRFNIVSHRMPIHALAFSADGNFLADASEDGDTNRWDVRTGKQVGERLQLNAPGDGVGAVAFAADGRMMATGGRASLANRKAFAVLWDAKEEKVTRALVGHSGFVTALAFSPDGARLATGSADHTVRIWDAVTGKQIVTSGIRVGVTAVALARTTKLLASASTDSAVRIWSTATGELLRLLLGHAGAVNAVAFTRDESKLASGGKDGAVRIWNPANGALLRTWRSTNGEIRVLCISPDGMQIATAHKDGVLTGAIELRDIGTGALLKTLDYKGLRPVDSLAFSPDGSLLASGGGSRLESDSELRLWDVKSGEPVATRRAENTGSVMALAFSPNGKYLVTANDIVNRFDDPRETFAGELKVWNGKTLAYQRGMPLPTPETWADSITFLDDNETVVSGGEDGLLRKWNVRTGKPEGQFASQHLGPVTALNLQSDGSFLASGGADNTIRIWNSRDGTLLLTLATLPASTAIVDAGDAAPSTDWLAATSEGYYDGSANASRQIQWRVGPDLFPLDSYEAQRHRPDVLRQTLNSSPPGRNPSPPPGPANTSGGHSTGAANVGGNAHSTGTHNGGGGKFHSYGADIGGPGDGRAHSSGATTGGAGNGGPPTPSAEPDPLAAPPQITFATPSDGERIAGETIKVSGFVSDAVELSSIALRVNGRNLKTKPLTIGAKRLTAEAKAITIGAKALTIGAKPLTIGAKPLPYGHKFYQTFEGEVQLPTADSEIVITALAEDRNHLTAREDIHVLRASSSEKGTLYVLAVGITHYKNPTYNLKYASSDAEAFAAMWQQHAGALYKDVRVTQLTDERATAESVRAALFKLAEQATANDCVAIFLSGHGVQDGDKYYFATSEIEPVQGRLDATALPWSALQLTLAAVQARRVILFLDACHAGNALGGMQANSERIAEALVKRAGVMVFASSRGAELSYELDDVKHGAFTEALLEGIGEAKANLVIADQKADTISAEDLLAYLRRRVPQLTDNRQTPSCPLIRDFGDAFPLVQLR